MSHRKNVSLPFSPDEFLLTQRERDERIAFAWVVREWGCYRATVRVGGRELPVGNPCLDIRDAEADAFMALALIRAAGGEASDLVAMPPAEPPRDRVAEALDAVVPGGAG